MQRSRSDVRFDDLHVPEPRIRSAVASGRLLMPRISARQLDFVFRPPTIEPTEGWNSTLHLVRREIQDSLAGSIAPENTFLDRRRLHRLFASTIVMCTAFDLLAKLRYGDTRGVGDIFIKLLVRHGEMHRVVARRIWDARNALTHSFGLRIVKHRGRVVSSVRIQLSDDVRLPAVLRFTDGSRRWQISVPGLYRLLIEVITGVERELRQTTRVADVTRFAQMVNRYGRIRMRH